MPETKEIAQTEYEEGEYLKVIKDLDNLSVGDLVQYIGDEGDGCVRIECKGLGVGVVLQDCVEKLPILTEPVPIGSEVVKIKEDGRGFDKYLGKVFEVFSGKLPNHRILVAEGIRYGFHNSDLSNWALVEAAKVETEFEADDLVIAKEDYLNGWERINKGQHYRISEVSGDLVRLTDGKEFFLASRFKKIDYNEVIKVEGSTTETREFQGECLDIDQLLAKCHTLAAKKSFISKIFEKGYWV